jgi:hypothetical protein
MAAHRTIKGFVSMWPREICDIRKPGKRNLFIGEFEPLQKPGVYVLYRDDQPHYIGQAERLSSRIHDHANKSTDRYYNFWNFFSAFVVTNKRHLNEVETILIAAMPTANSSRPRMPEIKIPKDIVAQMRGIRRHETNPVTRKDFAKLLKEVREIVRKKKRGR